MWILGSKSIHAFDETRRFLLRPSVEGGGRKVGSGGRGNKRNEEKEERRGERERNALI